MAKNIVRQQKITRDGRDAWITIEAGSAGMHAVHLYDSVHSMNNDAMAGWVLYSGATDGIKAFNEAIEKYSDKAAAPAAAPAAKGKEIKVSSKAPKKSSGGGGMLKKAWNFMTADAEEDEEIRFTYPDGSAVSEKLNEDLNDMVSDLKDWKTSITLGEQDLAVKVKGKAHPDDSEKKAQWTTVMGIFPLQGLDGSKLSTIAYDFSVRAPYKQEKLTFIIENSVLPDSWLAGDADLVELSILKNVKVGNHAFENCPNLEDVDFEKIPELGRGAFMGCTKLETVNLSNSGLAEVPESAFEGCTALETIEFPKSVNKVDSRAFANCTGLKKVVFKNKDIVLAPDAFANCPNIEKVETPKLSPAEQAALVPVFAGTKWATNPKKGGNKVLRTILIIIAVIILLAIIF